MLLPFWKSDQEIPDFSLFSCVIFLSTQMIAILTILSFYYKWIIVRIDEDLFLISQLFQFLL